MTRPEQSHTRREMIKDVGWRTVVERSISSVSHHTLSHFSLGCAETDPHSASNYPGSWVWLPRARASTLYTRNDGPKTEQSPPTPRFERGGRGAKSRQPRSGRGGEGGGRAKAKQGGKARQARQRSGSPSRGQCASVALVRLSADEVVQLPLVGAVAADEGLAGRRELDRHL